MMLRVLPPQLRNLWLTIVVTHKVYATDNFQERLIGGQGMGNRISTGPPMYCKIRNSILYDIICSHNSNSR